MSLLTELCPLLTGDTTRIPVLRTCCPHPRRPNSGRAGQSCPGPGLALAVGLLPRSLRPACLCSRPPLPLASGVEIRLKIAQPFMAGFPFRKRPKSRPGTAESFANTGHSFVPAGTWLVGLNADPAINGWAIVRRSCPDNCVCARPSSGRAGQSGPGPAMRWPLAFCPGPCVRPDLAVSHHAAGTVIFVGDEVTSLILISDWRLRIADFQFETPHVVSYIPLKIAQPFMAGFAFRKRPKSRPGTAASFVPAGTWLWIECLPSHKWLGYCHHVALRRSNTRPPQFRQGWPIRPRPGHALAIGLLPRSLRPARPCRQPPCPARAEMKCV